MIRTTAVSYTHLDVYKRQDLVKTRFGKTRSRRVYKNLFEYFEQQLSFGGK